jgi:hypothetical protein
MRDLSLLLVPATDLIHGPKWSEHQKHFINEVSKELNLDAVIVVMSQLAWTASHFNRHTGVSVPEEFSLKLKASTLVPFHSYHERLSQIHLKQNPMMTVCYRHYASEINVPLMISVPEENKNFSSINKELLLPVMKSYKDLSQMMILRLTDDLRLTFHGSK